MSLATDSIFIAAISANEALMQRIGGRLYSTSIPLPDEDLDNAPVPYVIVCFDGLTNDQTTKDDPFESDSDQVNISIEVAAENRTTLAELMQTIRETVHAYMLAQVDADANFPIEDYQFSADAIQYVAAKPCYWQTLRYQCDVFNVNEETDEQEND